VLLDLSAITDALIDHVKNQWATAPIWAELGLGGPSFTPNVTGLAPDRVRDGDGPQLSIFLYHVESDNAREALWWKPEMLRSGGQPVRYLPLALSLYYLVSAFSEGSYSDEQQAMSVALRLFHENAVLRSTPPPDPLAWELTLTMEHRSYDELSRLWQATTAPLRLGVVYRAAVVFLTPEQPGGPAPAVEEVALFVKQPLDAPLADADLVKVTLP